MTVDADKLASMVSAIYLHKDPISTGLITNEEEAEAWKSLVVEVEEIVADGGVPYFEDYTG